MAERNNTKVTAILLGTFLVLALVLRIAFNMGVAFDEETNRYLYSGNDPWYHDRIVDHILETGESLTFDEAINYPNGGKNPNPPIFDWTTAIDAKLLDMFGAQDPTGLALNLSVAFWGALTIIPVFFIGKQLFGRNAGLWGAFFMAVSAPSIQRGVFGFADHDATTMFFITSSFAFLLKALSVTKQEKYLENASFSGIVAAKKNAFAANKEGMIWSALSGVALAGAALTWKGYPYALAIMAVGFGFQLIVSHLKNRDATAIAAVYVLPVLVTFLLSLPYYSVLGLTASTVMPNLYVLLGMLLVGAILVPTRDMPSIVVFPALLVTGALGLIVMLLIVPEVGKTIFTGLGYFEQTKLYTTIAEAQRTELGFVAANFGFFTFLLSFWALYETVTKAIKGNAPMMLMASWALVAGFMAFAASRFVMNAAPVFVVLAGAATAWLVTKSGVSQVSRNMRSLHGQGGAVGNFFKSLTPKVVLSSLLIALFLVGPNVAMGLDAGMSRDYEQQNDVGTKFTGAYGIGFDIKNNGWYELFNELATRDTDVPLEDRPAFMAWWDYGHWATNIGEHPTVADPFQNHFRQAGAFLASESEEEGMLWLSILLVGGSDEATTGDVLAAHGAPRALTGTLNERFAQLETVADPFALYNDLSDATGDHIGYFGVDSRMYPVSQDRPGIFYAPVFLADKNPDDFLSYSFVGGGLTLELNRYGVDENGVSYQLPSEEQLWTNDAGDEYVVIGNTAYPASAVLGGHSNPQGISGQSGFQLTSRFDDTMYAKAYGGPDASATVAGEGLSHWRLVHESTAGQFRLTALLEYFRGYDVSGTVTDENGSPMEGIEVTFVDEFGASHDVGTTDANGNYEVVAPFGDLTMELRAGGAAIYSESMTVTREQANGESLAGKNVQVDFGSVNGLIFRDLDGDNMYTANDTLVAGATVSVDGQEATTGNDGSYSFNGVTPGSVTIAVTADGYSSTSSIVVLEGGAMVEENVQARPLTSTAAITFTDGGEAVSGVPMTIEGPTSTNGVTNATGVANTVLEPGMYTVTIDHSFTEDGVEVIYSEARQFTVPFGGEDFTFTISA